MPTPPKRRWDELTSADIAPGEVADWVAVLPLGATEQHGPHLPLGTDTMIGEALLDRVVEAAPESLPLVVLPTLPYGKSDEHTGFPGTLSLPADLLAATVVEIGASLARSGLRRLVVLSSHGGNSEAMGIAARTLRLEHHMLVVATNWMRLGQPERLFAEEELRFGIHGGDVETSLMMHFEPDLVRREELADFVSEAERMARRFEVLSGTGGTGMAWAIEDLNPAGAVGNAAIASPDKGRLSARHAAARMVRLLQEVAAYTPDFLTAR